VGTSDDWPESKVRSGGFWRPGPLLLQLGGGLFLVLGVVLAVMTFVDAGNYGGSTLTRRFLVTAGPLTLAAVGLVGFGVGAILNHLLNLADQRDS